jgi:hypothetical protein
MFVMELCFSINMKVHVRLQTFNEINVLSLAMMLETMHISFNGLSAICSSQGRRPTGIPFTRKLLLVSAQEKKAV